MWLWGRRVLFSPLLEKIKYALRDQRCAACRRDGLAQQALLCEGCLRALGLRDPKPLRIQHQARLFAASTFSPKLRRLLYGYKFNEQRDATDILSSLLITYWKTLPLTHQALPGIVCPIPEREGQVNHLLPYARSFSQYFGYAFEPQALQWTRETAPQHSLHQKTDRIANLQGSLLVNENALKRYSDRAKMVIIVDDILTTGTTLGEALRAFRNSAAVTDRETVGLTLTHIPLAYNRF